MNNKVNTITYGALLSAIAVVFALIANYINSPDSIFYFLVSMPVIYYYYKFNLKSSLVLVISTLIICLIFTNPITCMLLTLPSLVIGLFLGVTYKKNNIFIIFAIAISYIFDLLVTYKFSYIFGIDFIKSVKDLASLFTENVDLIVNIVPSFLLFYAIVKVLFIFIITSLVINRLENESRVLTIRSDVFVLKGIYLGINIIFYISIFIACFYLADGIIKIILLNILFLSFLVISFYTVYKVNIYLVFRYNIKKRLILALVLIILFPLSLIYGIYLNIVGKI